jgi:replication initiation protein RepC
MQPHISTTPFGGRPLTRAMMDAQAEAGRAGPDDVAHKWRVWRNLAIAKEKLCVSDRALAVLNALLSFHQATALQGDDDLVVFPSNRELSLRAHGMAPATLRRHLAALVETGLVIRRDSPNGKRYARKGEGGQVEQAFGFDLMPLVARAAELQALAEAVTADLKAAALLRERITILRRDIGKSIELGLEEDAGGADWVGMTVRLAELSQGLLRRLDRSALDQRAADLDDLYDKVSKALERHTKEEEKDAKESQSERHIQNSKPDTYTESEPRFTKSGGKTDALVPAAKQGMRSFPLQMVLSACPTIVDYAKGGSIESWRDLIVTSDFVRSMLGISPSAWDLARNAFGMEDAAVVIAAMLERSDSIKSPGGYLRGLTEKQASGQFSIGPMLMALLRASPKLKQHG